MAEVGGFSPATLVTLGEKGIKTLDDLGDLASDELVEILGEDSIDEETANAIIMAARQHWFEGEEGAAEAAGHADTGNSGEETDNATRTEP